MLRPTLFLYSERCAPIQRMNVPDTGSYRLGMSVDQEEYECLVRRFIMVFSSLAGYFNREATLLTHQ